MPNLIRLSPFLIAAVVTADASDSSMHNRHYNDRPLEINVDAMASYQSKSLSSGGGCLPESDGYFGATSGPPSIIDYGFTMETTPLGSVKKIAGSIEQLVWTTMLANAFPQICGFAVMSTHTTTPSHHSQQSRHLGGRANGFHFGEIVRTEEACTKVTSEVNYCGVFQGQIQVFGREQGDIASKFLELLRRTLDPSYSQGIHADLIELKPVIELMRVTAAKDGKEDKGFQFSDLTNFQVAAFAFCFIMLIGAMIWCCLVIRDRRRMRDRQQAIMKRDGILRTNPYDPESQSIAPVSEDEAINLRGDPDARPGSHRSGGSQTMVRSNRTAFGGGRKTSGSVKSTSSSSRGSSSHSHGHSRNSGHSSGQSIVSSRSSQSSGSRSSRSSASSRGSSRSSGSRTASGASTCSGSQSGSSTSGGSRSAESTSRGSRSAGTSRTSGWRSGESSSSRTRSERSASEATQITFANERRSSRHTVNLSSESDCDGSVWTSGSSVTGESVYTDQDDAGLVRRGILS